MNEQFTPKDIITALLLSFKASFYDFEEIQGVTVTLYKFRPKLGTRIARIRSLKDELSAALHVPSVRIIAPMEDGCVGIEVPKTERKTVPFFDIAESPMFRNTNMELPFAVGRTVTNEIFIADLAEMPHLLVAGATGQGKSVGLNTLLLSLLSKKSPDELKLVLIDPKKVELGIYSDLEQSYLACPVITESEDALLKLESLCNIMDERYSLISSVGVRNIREYNAISIVEKMPYIVVVIDEYGDLVMTSGRKLEQTVCRLAQKARAVGIHVVLSTQRPDTKIVTGNIKANFPTRIAFRTTTGIDSRVILDQLGAEKLNGKGDMLFSCGVSTIRIQCAYASVSDVVMMCDWLRVRYREYKNVSMFSELKTEELPVVRPKLSLPLHPLTKPAAMLVADQPSVTETWVKVWMNTTFQEARCVFNQLIELGILQSCRSEGFLMYTTDRRNVLMHDKTKISELIDSYV